MAVVLGGKRAALKSEQEAGRAERGGGGHIGGIKGRLCETRQGTQADRPRVWNAPRGNRGAGAFSEEVKSWGRSSRQAKRGPGSRSRGPEASQKGFHKNSPFTLENGGVVGDLGSQVMGMRTPTQPQTKRDR